MPFDRTAALARAKRHFSYYECAEECMEDDRALWARMHYAASVQASRGGYGLYCGDPTVPSESGAHMRRTGSIL